MTEDQTRKRFEEYRDKLLDECQYFVACVHISKRFREQQIKEPKLFNTASCFWGVSMKSVFVSIVLWAEKLFCEHQKTKQVDVWKFLNFVERYHSTLFPRPYVSRFGDEWSATLEDIKKHRAKLKNLKGMPAVNHLRDKYYAHFDGKFFLNRKKLWAGVDVDFLALEEMGTCAEDVLLHYSLAYDGVGFGVRVTNIDDISGLFGLIERYFQKQREELSKWNKGARGRKSVRKDD